MPLATFPLFQFVLCPFDSLIAPQHRLHLNVFSRHHLFRVYPFHGPPSLYVAFFSQWGSDKALFALLSLFSVGLLAGFPLISSRVLFGPLPPSLPFLHVAFLKLRFPLTGWSFLAHETRTVPVAFHPITTSSQGSSVYLFVLPSSLCFLDPRCFFFSPFRYFFPPRFSLRIAGRQLDSLPPSVQAFLFECSVFFLRPGFRPPPPH